MSVATDERFHALDSLRAAAMLLGIFFHAALAYVDPPLDFWVVQDASRHAAFGVFAWASHSFRMPLFFVMAGFFARLVFHRYGARRFLRHRLVRLVVPFSVGVLADNAIQQSFFHYTYAAGLVVPDAVWLAREAAQPLTWANFLAHFDLGVYWFLLYLICFSAAAVVVGSLATRRPRRARSAKLDRRFAALVRSGWKPLWLAIPQAALLYATGEWGVGSPSGILPELVWLAYYGIFFAFGWALHRQRTLLLELRHRYRRDLLLAVVVGALAAGTSFVGYLGDPPAPALLRGIALLLTASFTWLMIFGLTGLFLRIFRKERRSIRYVSDSSYWLYLTHDYYVMGLQILLAPLLLPAALKYAIVMTVALSALFVTYEYGVRYTFIGAVLNGRKRRRKTRAAHMVVGAAAGERGHG